MKIVLVEPQYEINLGMILRLIKNFGQTSLILVNPQVNIKGKDVIKFSKHAKDLIDKIAVVDKLEKAVEDCEVLIGTSGIIKRYKKTYKSPIGLSKLKDKIVGIDVDKICLIFGREGVGLKQQELDLCDVVVHIETDEKYPVLNLSHAVGIMLYELSKNSKKKTGTYAQANKKQLNTANLLFSFFVDRYSNKLRNPSKIKIAFKRILSRAFPEKSEITCLLNIFKKLKKELMDNG